MAQRAAVARFAESEGLAITLRLAAVLPLDFFCACGLLVHQTRAHQINHVAADAMVTHPQLTPLPRFLSLRVRQA
jgi:hypothetical protein